MHPICYAQVIEELDEKKRWALEDTWTKVNEWFGSIFSSLLPGTQAKLEPPEGATWESGRLMNLFESRIFWPEL